MQHTCQSWHLTPRGPSRYAEIVRFPRVRRLAFAALAALAACGRPSEPPPPETAEQRDRRELTLQARRDWKPESAGRKMTILLILDKSSIRRGESPRYRLEIRNVGREPLAFREAPPSFIKDGSLCGTEDFRILLKSKRGEESLPCEPEISPPASSGLDLTLKSGDYLLTRPDGPRDRFRALRAGRRFDSLGRYRLKVVYSAGGLRAASNSVNFSVVR